MKDTDKLNGPITHRASSLITQETVLWLRQLYAIWGAIQL